jgi:hypothetical protein
MTKEQEIKELTEWITPQLSELIPYETPDYEAVLFKEARFIAEVLYEYRTNPEGYNNVKSMMPEPIIDINELHFRK